MENSTQQTAYYLSQKRKPYTRHIAVGDRNNFVVYPANNMYSSFEVSRQEIEIIGKVIWRSGFI